MTLSGNQAIIIQEEAKSLFEVAWAQHQQGNDADALRLFEEVLGLLNQIGDRNGQAFPAPDGQLARRAERL